MNSKLSLNGLHAAAILSLAASGVFAYLHSQDVPTTGKAWAALGLGALSAGLFAVARSVFVPGPSK